MYSFSGGNVLCLNIWGMNSGPYMQALHFSFGVGAFVAPLIAEPFLAQGDFNATNVTEKYELVHFNAESLPNLSDIKNKNDAHQKRNKRQVESEDSENSFSTSTVPSSSLPVNSSQAEPKIHRPISTGEHLSGDPKIADGSSVGKQISKIEQNKQKEKTKDPPKEAEVKPEKVEKENNETLTNETSSLNSETNEKTTTTTTTTTKPPTTTTTTKTTTTTTTTQKPATTLKHDDTIHAILTGNATVVSDPPETQNVTEKKNDSKSTVKKKFNEIIQYVNKMPSMISEFTKVQFSFLIIATFLFIIAVMFMCLCCCTNRTIRSVRNAVHQENYIIHKESKGFRVQILILLFIFYFLYVGMEVTYGGLIMTFSVQYLDWSKAEGTMLTSVFWGAFAIGRGLAIFLAKCLSPAIMLIADLVLSCLALGGLVMALDSNHYILWFCTAMLGIGMASIFPTGITWAERYMRVTGKAAAVFVVGSALGEMALPALTGFLFQSNGPMWLLYIMLGTGIASAVLYIIMQNLATNKGERYERLSRRSSSMNGITADGDMDDIEGEMESVLSDNLSETSSAGGGVVRKKTVLAEENDSLISNGSTHHSKANGTKPTRKKKKRGPFSGKVSYKRI